MLSIIIPAYNEEESLPQLLSYLTSCCKKTGVKFEILVVDGGSTDQTNKKALKEGALVIFSSKRGRAKQMNLGSKQAKGEILYFLHADSYPPETFAQDITKATKEGSAAGCFRLAFDDQNPLLAFYAWFTRFDINIFRFGDQSLFVEKKAFEEAGGFDEQLVVMEDQEIVSRLKSKYKFSILPKNVKTSARKYRQVGVIKLQLIFTAILTGYYLGLSQDKLVNFYKRMVE
ncbi:MAG: glycosyltransferase [Balneola sp.]|nr:MAG: glycosyltransferase [Balneola sp.]